MNKMTDKERLTAVEVVVDALISLLHKKKIVTRDQIQLEILDRAEGEDNENS